MSIPGFTAEASVYHTGNVYAAAPQTGARLVGRIVPSIPLCINCDHVCDVCERSRARGGRIACGACALCLYGICDEGETRQDPFS
jgi:hypothetical protein